MDISRCFSKRASAWEQRGGRAPVIRRVFSHHWQHNVIVVLPVTDGTGLYPDCYSKHDTDDCIFSAIVNTKPDGSSKCLHAPPLTREKRQRSEVRSRVRKDSWKWDHPCSRNKGSLATHRTASANQEYMLPTSSGCRMMNARRPCGAKKY
jgi:hypothetical protein